MINQWYGYLYEIIIPATNGKKHYYGKKEYNKPLLKNTIYTDYWGSGVNISRACKDQSKTYKCYHWKYI